MAGKTFKRASKSAKRVLPLALLAALGTGAWMAYAAFAASPGPTVSSFTLVNASPTAAATVSWKVVFSSSVTGVATGDVTLVQAGGVSGAGSLSVSGSATTYTISASTGSGSDTLSLKLSSAGSIQDASHHSLQGVPYTGPVYTIDTAAPTGAITFPAAGGLYTAAGYNAGCSSPGICGSASDSTGVASVRVSIKAPSGKFWNGSGFTASSETFNAASGTTGWKYPLVLPGDGLYTVHVQATDTVGNAETGSTYAASGTFTIDTVAPAKPTVSSGTVQYPPLGWPSTSATFGFADTASDVASYRCELSPAATFTACTNPVTVTGLAQGQHTLLVEAVDHAGNVSQPSTPYTFFVDTIKPNTPTFAQTPPNPNSVSTSTFAWTDVDPGDSTNPPTGTGIVGYLCSVENGAFLPLVPSDGGLPKLCTSPLTYTVGTTSNGVHQFAVEAIDWVGNISQVASYSWKVQKGSGQNYTIGSNLTAPLLPGAPSTPINLTFSNANTDSVQVNSLTVTVQSVTGGSNAPNPCTTADFAVTQYSGAYPFYVPIGSSSLSTISPAIASNKWPTVRMLDRQDSPAGSGNGSQNGCVGATVHLGYSSTP